MLAVGLTACGGGDDDQSGQSEVDAGALGEALGQAGDQSSPSNRSDVNTTTTAAGSGESQTRRDLPELPPPDIPSESSPPTTVPGTESLDWPIGFGDGETLPLLGEIVVDLEPNGYADFPVSLVEGKRAALISAGDDGVLTYIEVFRPDGTSEGSWE
ncbi:MAG TPA: hypothetical protein VGJ86_26345, partial [Acidimicrobiales bacterium]